MRTTEYGFYSLLLALSLGSRGSFAQHAAPTKACVDPVHRQFDFWLGDWDVFEVEGGSKSAHVLVETILDGCVLLETSQGVNGENGKSFTIYDASRNQWHQSWVTNRGQLLEIDGTFEAGSIKLKGVDRAPGAQERLV